MVDDAIPVTVDNFTRAETDMYFARSAGQSGGIGRLFYRRGLFDVRKQSGVRGNRDTLYSTGVFDLGASPLTFTLPDAGNRFTSLMGIDEDHFIPFLTYDPGTYTFTREQIGTRYLYLAVRMLTDPADSADLEEVHALQDAIVVQQDDRGRLELPDWDRASRQRIHDALVILGESVPDSAGMFGSRDQVDPARHLIGTATLWGGNPATEAMYLTVTPERNDGTTRYTLTVRDVPVDGFWSISVYNRDGYFEPNDAEAYSVNSVTAKKAADGSVVVEFGGSDSKVNCLPITPGWNYTVRLYRPRPEILDGTWTFPAAVAAASAAARTSA